jgi:D-tagatose-1,6-bisphosphate aldolase subunit GatZ/KbaZ
MAFEAHSTDYQPDAVFHALARRHFAILKVGPALTFAYRRALYALDELVRLYRNDASSTPLPTVMENLMLARPDHWKTHYAGADDTTIRILRHYAYADRIRYYWNLPEAVAAVAALERSFAGLSPAEPALLQYFPHAVVDRAETLRASGYPLGKSLILAEIQSALAPYLSVAPQAGQPEPEQKLRA